jgi:hypothetical protein
MQHRAELARVVDALVAHETLEKDDFAAVLTQRRAA